MSVPDWRIIEQGFTLAGGRTGCSALLSLAEPPTAIVCCIDQLAVGCMVEAQSRGLAVPADAATARHFANCTALNKVYPHGVGLKGAHDHTSGTPVTNFARKPAVYRANSGSDRDGDRIACEKA